MEKIQLTTDEIELLITISAIIEYSEENFEGELAPSIGEVIVSSNIMDEDEYKELANRLSEYGLLDDKDYLTDAGQNYINQLKEDGNSEEKGNNTELKNDYSMIDFVKIKEWLKEAVSKIDIEKAIDAIYKVSAIIDTIAKIANT